MKGVIHMKKKDIHKPGRPLKYNDDFYLKIIDLYENHTTGQIAEMYHVSRVSVSNWLKRGRELICNDKKSV